MSISDEKKKIIHNILFQKEDNVHKEHLDTVLFIHQSYIHDYDHLKQDLNYLYKNATKIEKDYKLATTTATYEISTRDLLEYIKELKDKDKYFAKLKSYKDDEFMQEYMCDFTTYMKEDNKGKECIKKKPGPSMENTVPILLKKQKIQNKSIFNILDLKD